MEDAQIIRGYHADIDYEEVDGRLINQFICTTTGTERERVARRILGISNVINVREVMTGHGDVQVKAIGTDTDSIARTARNIKTLGADIEEEDLIHREHFSTYGPFGPDDEYSGSPITGIADLAGDADIVEVEIGDGALIAGKTVQGASEEGLVEGDVLIITIERGEQALTPHGETTIEKGDRVTLLTRTGLPNNLIRNFTGE
ncbi:TrkA C-terminal domain-containing protein [Halobium palmae]|uniref:TrkA C-terminal domain-containing protein n=1 Tax=Halobium palmae TaxID=1776492 RepID=A0ABD5RU66_9EURY